MGRETGKNLRAGKTETLVKYSYLGIAKVSQVFTICSCAQCTLSDQDNRVRDVQEQSTDLAHTTRCD